jgi:hypothetical protein
MENYLTIPSGFDTGFFEKSRSNTAIEINTSVVQLSLFLQSSCVRQDAKI